METAAAAAPAATPQAAEPAQPDDDDEAGAAAAAAAAASSAEAAATPAIASTPSPEEEEKKEVVPIEVGQHTHIADKHAAPLSHPHPPRPCCRRIRILERRLAFSLVFSCPPRASAHSVCILRVCFLCVCSATAWTSIASWPGATSTATRSSTTTQTGASRSEERTTRHSKENRSTCTFTRPRRRRSQRGQHPAPPPRPLQPQRPPQLPQLSLPLPLLLLQSPPLMLHHPPAARRSPLRRTMQLLDRQRNLLWLLLRLPLLRRLLLPLRATRRVESNLQLRSKRKHRKQRASTKRSRRIWPKRASVD